MGDNAGQAHLLPIALQVTLHAWRHDDGRDDFDTACVWEHGTPGVHLVAADARRLGQALLRAADLLAAADELEGHDDDGPGAAGTRLSDVAAEAGL